MEDPQNAGAFAYMNAVRAILDIVAQTQGRAIDQAASSIVNSIKSGGMVYLFGTGHSHMMAEEGHTRAGGLAPVCPILSSSLMIHESAASASKLERLTGLAATLLVRYQLTSKDVLIIFSNSGVNAVPVEMAMLAKQIGLTVIAVVALEYTLHAPLSPVGKRLNEIVDIVIDNQGPQGDALVAINGTNLKVGAPSTVAGAFILNAIFTEVAWRIAAEGDTPPVYISGNMPNAAEHNSVLHEQYRSRNPHM
jgi:uncharacterized phosphosugar-binding protein